MAVDSNGNVVVTGYSQNGAPNYDYDYYTAKYAAANGTLLWEKATPMVTPGRWRWTAAATSW